jgi:hypothetical protein
MKSTPSSAMTMPEICRSSARLSWSVWPRPVAVIPSATNIAVKARQNRIAGPSTCARPFPSWMSANETPEMVER